VEFNSNTKDLLLLHIFSKEDISNLPLMLYKNLNTILQFLLGITSISLLFAIKLKRKLPNFCFYLVSWLLFLMYFFVSVLSLYGLYETYFGYLICIIAVLTCEYYYNFFKSKLIG
jgi:hypothetical protein